MNTDYRPFSSRYIRNILATEKLWLSRNRGQNYLICREIAEKIVKSLPANVPVFEVGCGLGALSHLTAEKQSITAVEIDFGVYKLFRRLFSHPNLTLIHADFLKFDFNLLTDREWYFLSNLPYSISGEALRVFVNETRFKSATLMLQKEFTERMNAKEGSKHYGLLSVLSQTFLEIKNLIPLVRRQCFFPEPSVDSTVVLLHKKQQDFSQEDFRQFVMIGFAKRRKTLANNLKSLGITPNQIENIGLNPKTRPEQICPADWIRLYKLFIRVRESL